MTGEKCKPEVAKTGLGSSAAMTASAVAALLHYLGAVKLSCLGQSSSDSATGQDLDLVHAIAQSAHCIAGKIGSDFDVSVAAYGSQHYTRFSPEILSSAQVTGGSCLPDVVEDIVTRRWDHEKTPFSLPPMMSLEACIPHGSKFWRLAQEIFELRGELGTGGSFTPSMVGSVKQWQKSDAPKSRDTWSKLEMANSVLENELRNLNKLAEDHWEAYESVVRSCSHVTYMKIEPESQTQLLDATMNMEGVLLAGVPGADCFDAVFSVILGEASNAVANAWSSIGVLPLLVREDPRGVSLEAGDPRSRDVSTAVSSIQIN